MTRCSRHRGGYAAAMALVGLLAVAACGGHSGPLGPPKAGQARVIGQTTADGDIGPEESGDMRGMAAGAGGTVYIDTGERLVRLGTDGKFADVSGRQAGRPAPEDRGLSGLVIRSDGALLAGEDGQLVAVAPDGRITVLAGTAGQFRSVTASVAKSAAAAGFRFVRRVTPLGVEKDGTVVIADGNVVWSLSGGRLTQRYRQAPVKSAAEYFSPFLGAPSTTDPDGTVFLAPFGDTAALADVVVLPGDGQAPHKLRVPAQLAGAGVPTAELKPTFLAGDGADGVYADAFRTKGTGSYILHVHDGRIDVLASSTASAVSDTCGAHKSVAARDFPCYLPEGIAYRAGHVYLAGQRSYVLDIGAAAS
jgi:hypothetical protein